MDFLNYFGPLYPGACVHRPYVTKSDQWLKVKGTPYGTSGLDGKKMKLIA